VNLAFRQETDVADTLRPFLLCAAKTLQDLALSFFDTSGPNSRGAHCLWFVDGEYIHMASGASATADRDYARFPGLRWRHPLS
jgi:hypothetical protein